MSRHLLTSRTSFPPCPLWMKKKERPMTFLLRARKPG